MAVSAKNKVLGLFLSTMTVMSAVAPMVVSSQAMADEKVSSILFSCNLSFRATGRSVYVGIGYTDVSGSGTISCYDLLTGATEHVPVKVKARGPGAGLGVTGLVLSGAAAGVGVTKGPEDLLGRYGMVRGNAAVGVGGAAGVGLRLSKGSVSVDLSLEGQSGLGAGVDLLWVDLERDGESRLEAAPVKPAMPVAQAERAEVTTAESLPQATPIQISSSKTIYLQEGQPLQIIDKQGRVIQTIYLKTVR